MGYLIFTYKKQKKYPDTSEYPHQTWVEPKITLFLPTKSKKSIQIPRNTRTKHTSSLKLPYFYLQKAKKYPDTSEYPHQKHIEPKITLFLPTKSKKISRYIGIPAPNSHRSLKLPYFYLQKAKKVSRYLGIPAPNTHRA